jgi:hypothetical protein
MLEISTRLHFSWHSSDEIQCQVEKGQLRCCLTLWVLWQSGI